LAPPSSPGATKLMVTAVGWVSAAVSSVAAPGAIESSSGRAVARSRNISVPSVRRSRRPAPEPGTSVEMIDRSGARRLPSMPSGSP
jgi:hypothetical protein